MLAHLLLRLLIAVPLPGPSEDREGGSFPPGAKHSSKQSCPLPLNVIFVLHHFSGLEEVIKCFGLKALLLGCSLRGRIKVNK